MGMRYQARILAPARLVARTASLLPRGKYLVRAYLLTYPFLRQILYYLFSKSSVSLKRSLSRPSGKYSLFVNARSPPHAHTHTHTPPKPWGLFYLTKFKVLDLEEYLDNLIS